MSRLKILDLSYFQVATEEDRKVTGGWTVAGDFPPSRLIQSREISALNNLDGYEQTKIYSDLESVVKKLENPQTGESGYEVLSTDGTSRTVILSGPNSSRAISTMAIGY